MKPLTLTLAGIHIALESNNASAPVLPEVYARFITDTHPTADATYLVNITDPSTIHPIVTDQSPLWSCATWRLGYTADQQISIEIHNINTNHWHPVANATPDFTNGRILRCSGRQALPAIYSLNYPIDQALFINRLPHHSAGLVHGSAVVKDERAYLFCGPADIGKTTMARLWQQQGATVLNDDRNIIRIQNNQITISPSPWHGDLAEVNNKTLPLAAIFHLSQAGSNDWSPLQTLAAVSHLTATTVAPFYFKNSMEKQLEIWHTVCSTIPSYLLAFTPTAEVVNLCEEACDHDRT